VAGCPWCTPFRGSLLTGKYPHETGVVRTPSQLPPDQPTIAQTFNDAGYDTAYFGKWHLDGVSEARQRSGTRYIPPERRGGFKTWIGYENNNSQYDCYVHGHDRDGDEVEMYRLPDYETDSLTDLLLDHLEERADAPDQPFFAVLSVQPPHDPYVAPAEYGQRVNAATVQLRPNVPPVESVLKKTRMDLSGYYAMIENLDWNLGRVRQALRDLGLEQDTQVIFFSDHGDMHGSHGYNAKSQPWEESIRIPFHIAGGEPFYQLAAGETDAPLNSVDIAPTTLGLCGIDVPEWMSGYDWSHLRRRHDPARDDEPDAAYLQHLVRKYHKGGMDCTWRAIVTRDRWKYIVQENAPLAMFDLNTDPYELNNLIYDPTFKDRRKQLHDRLARFIQDTGDEYPLHDCE
jgi:arylsulfatase A-like enzyme